MSTTATGTAARALRQDAGAAVTAAVATALGAGALAPVFNRQDWLPGVLLVVAAVAVTGAVLRWAGPALWHWASGGRPPSLRWSALGVPLVPLGQLLAVGCVLTALFAPDRAVFDLVPTQESVADLGAVLRDGSAQIREQFTPADPLAGLCALTVLMMGILAVVVDLVAVGGRQPALAALPLLVVFCVPVSTIDGGIGLAAVALPVAGLALLLWADQHRRLSWQPRGGLRPAAGALPAVRTGLLALAAAMVLGSLVPTLGEGELADRWRAGSGGGGSTGTSLDPAASLQGELTREDPIDLLQVRATVADPGYLRAVALDVYDPEVGWTLDDLGDGQSLDRTDVLAPLPGRTASRPVEATVTVLEHDDHFLPVLSSPLDVNELDGAEDWRFDRASATVFSPGVTTTPGLTYVTTGVEPQPTPEQLAGAGELSPAAPEAALAAPPLLDEAVAEQVRTLTAGATTPAERVQAVYGWMTDPANGWVYSLTTEPGTTGDDLADFLENRRGYCEQYAGAMAAMVRAAGVPSRVVLGYTPGITQPDGSRLVTSNDAHAWVEVYFDGVGWVPYDPTPIDSDRAVALPWAPRPPDQEVDPRTDLPTAPLPVPAPTEAPVDRVDGEVPAAGAARADTGWAGAVLPVAAAVLGAAALVAAPAGLRTLQRRRRLATGSAAAAWDELAATARDLGLPWDPWETPRQVAVRLARALPGAPPPGRGAHRSDGGRGAGAREAVDRLARAEEAASYARPGSGPGPEELARAVHVARRGLLAAAEPRVRLRALLLPASVPGALGGLGAGRWLRRRTGGRRPRPAG
ncbi:MULTISPECIES: transglutaminase family protein [unclassified Blastococcus]